MFSIPNTPGECSFYDAEECDFTGESFYQSCEECMAGLLELILSNPPDVPEGYTAELTAWTILG